MKYWEFLIQKEGDQTWLPLETQQVEILEGRYRIVAHTDRANTGMEIRVSQLVTDELPPSRRVRKRISQTNEAGLAVVMPFVHLKPGQWELNCCSTDDISTNVSGNEPTNEPTDELTEDWHYSVQLQVFAHTEEDWSGEWPVPMDSETAFSTFTEHNEGDVVDLELVNQDLPLIQAQVELKTRLHSQGLEVPGNISGQAVSTDESAIDPLADSIHQFSYQIALRQQAYLARHDQPLTIMGKVNALLERMHEGTSQLWIRLQNPETAQVIMEAHRPLSLAHLPADFKVQIQLPVEVTTRVILGEVSLRTAALDPDDKAEVLAFTAFTITAGIDHLLDAIANQAPDLFEGEEDAAVPKYVSPPSTRLEPSLINSTWSVPSLNPTQASFVPAVGVVLPPQLNFNEFQSGSDGEAPPREDRTHPYPELPNFASQDAAAANLIVSAGASRGDSFSAEQSIQPPSAEPPLAVPPVTPVARAPMVSQPAQFLSSSIEDSDLEADEISAVLEDIDQDLRLEESDLDRLEPPGIEGVIPNHLTTAETVAPANHQADEPPEHSFDSQAANPASSQANSRSTIYQSQSASQQEEASLDFQSLKLKDHFWNRLSTLTHESHREAAKISQNMKEAGVSRGSFTLAAPSGLERNSEVVIYDEPSAAYYSNDAQVADTRPASLGGAVQPSIPQPAIPQNLNGVSMASSGRRSATRLEGSAQPSVRPLAAKQPGQMRVHEDLPEMALPVISVPMGDLVAGETITVTVRTRPSVYKPFVKLWMIDRQSRSLVIEPQLLTKLLPDAVGDLEVTTEMQIPMDCLDVQIAAIAVDMATQQESSKAIVNRHVIPANQSLPPRKYNF